MLESVKAGAGKAVAVVKEHPVATAALAVPAVGALLAVGIVIYQRRTRRAPDPDGLTPEQRDYAERLERAYR